MFAVAQSNSPNYFVSVKTYDGAGYVGNSVTINFEARGKTSLWISDNNAVLIPNTEIKEIKIGGKN
jgi:hypothetical protein